MGTLRTWLVVLLALVWVPVTSHCRIEALTDVELLQCDAGPHPDHATPESGQPCGDEDTCCAVEFAKYQSPREQDFVPTIVTVAVPVKDFVVIPRVVPAESRSGILTAAPPAGPVCWQFLLRTALPPRAPSFAS